VRFDPGRFAAGRRLASFSLPTIQYENMSKSALDLHLRSAIAIQKGSSLSLVGYSSKDTQSKRRTSTKEVKVVKSTKSNGKERNFLDDARKDMQGKKTTVDTIVKSLGENGSSKKFSKRRLKSLIKLQRTR